LDWENYGQRVRGSQKKNSKGEGDRLKEEGSGNEEGSGKLPQLLH